MKIVARLLFFYSGLYVCREKVLEHKKSSAKFALLFLFYCKCVQITEVLQLHDGCKRTDSGR